MIGWNPGYNWTRAEFDKITREELITNNKDVVILDTEHSDARNEQQIVAWAKECGWDAEVLEWGERIKITKKSGSKNGNKHEKENERDTEILDNIIEFLSIGENPKTMIKLMYGRFEVTREELVKRFHFNADDVKECAAAVDADEEEIPGLVIT